MIKKVRIPLPASLVTCQAEINIGLQGWRSTKVPQCTWGSDWRSREVGYCMVLLPVRLWLQEPYILIYRRKIELHTSLHCCTETQELNFNDLARAHKQNFLSLCYQTWLFLQKISPCNVPLLLVLEPALVQRNIDLKLQELPQPASSWCISIHFH